jgi:hypothetical protein
MFERPMILISECRALGIPEQSLPILQSWVWRSRCPGTSRSQTRTRLNRNQGTSNFVQWSLINPYVSPFERLF